MRLFSSGAGLTGENQYFKAICLATDLEGDFVYVMGNKVGAFYQVTKTDISTDAKVPAIGVIVRKQTSTFCTVQTTGLVRNLLTNLTPNATVFVGDDSRATETIPPRPLAGYKYIQIVGRSMSETEFILSPMVPTIIIAD